MTDIVNFVPIGANQTRDLLDALTVLRKVKGLGTDTLTLELDNAAVVTLSATGGVVTADPSVPGTLRRAAAITRCDGLNTATLEVHTWDGAVVLLDASAGFFAASAARELADQAPLAFDAGGTAKASLTTALVGANNDVTFEPACGLGPEGNNYSVEYVVSGSNTPLSIEGGQNMKVHVETDPDGFALSTALQIVVATTLDGSIASRFFFAHVASGSGAGGGVVTAMAQTYLTGGA